MRKLWIYYIILFSLDIRAEITINEVMSNVSGNESEPLSPGDRNEFVELYNCSDTSVNILRFSISDGSADDRIVLFSDTVPYPGGITDDSIVPPHSYILILDPEYVLIGDSVNYMPYEIPDSAYVFTLSTTTFGDNGLSSNNFLYLLDGNDSLEDAFGTPESDDEFPYDPGDGISLEKINFFYADGITSYKPSEDSTGSTPGRKNSVFVEGSSIDSVKAIVEGISTRLSVFLSYLNAYSDKLVIEYEGRAETIAVDSSVMVIVADNEKDRIMNVRTLSSERTFTVLTRSFYNSGTIAMNEFMVKGNEWIEIYNPHSVDFYLEGTILKSGDDSLIFSHGRIDGGGYAIISSDTASVKSDYYDLPLNLIEASLFSLPDREDTFELLFRGVLADSAVRGFENTQTSVERINPFIKGAEKRNWDECIEFRGATPCMRNSIYFEFTETSDFISIQPVVLTDEFPNLLLKLNLSEHQGIVNAKLFDDLGTLIERPVLNLTVSSCETLLIKNLPSRLKNGLYLLYVTVEMPEKSIARLLKFAVRNN